MEACPKTQHVQLDLPSEPHQLHLWVQVKFILGLFSFTSLRYCRTLFPSCHLNKGNANNDLCGKVWRPASHPLLWHWVAIKRLKLHVLHSCPSSDCILHQPSSPPCWQGRWELLTELAQRHRWEHWRSTVGVRDLLTCPSSECTIVLVKCVRDTGIKWSKKRGKRTNRQGNFRSRMINDQMSVTCLGISWGNVEPHGKLGQQAGNQWCSHSGLNMVWKRMLIIINVVLNITGEMLDPITSFHFCD